ncbi:MAG TPA: response regulator [Gemmatimonadaceae bacterium]
MKSQPHTGHGAHSAHTKRHRSRLFVIDDESSIRSAISRFLTRRDWEVEEAEDGARALEMLLGSEPGFYDVVMCDLRMPNCSGAELYRALVAARPDLIRRLVFSSGDVASVEASTFLSSSGRPVIEKPFELAQLEEVFGRILDDLHAVDAN